MNHVGSLAVPLIHPVEWVGQQHKAPNGTDNSDTRTNAANLEHPQPSWAHANTEDMDVKLNMDRSGTTNEEWATGEGDHSIRRSFDGSNWGRGQFDGNRGTLVSLDVGETQQEAPWNSTHDWWGGGPHPSHTHGTNWTQRTWKILPTTDCKGGNEAHKRKKNWQGMSHGMPGGNMGQSEPWLD